MLLQTRNHQVNYNQQITKLSEKFQYANIFRYFKTNSKAVQTFALNDVGVSKLKLKHIIVDEMRHIKTKFR